MNKKNTVTRWLLKQNDTKTVDIIHREVSRYAPLNRILDKVGFYELQFFNVNDDHYFCTFLTSEKDFSKSMIHVGKRLDGQLVDMTDKDLLNFPKMKAFFFDSTKNKKH